MQTIIITPQARSTPNPVTESCTVYFNQSFLTLYFYNVTVLNERPLC